MGLLELFLIAVGLSMDAFAVSVCKGLSERQLKAKHYLIIGAWFGGFQALMPAVGYLLGSTFEQYITAVDHWIAFVLLCFIGGNMIREALSKDEEKLDASFSFKTMLLLAIATSIDALAVGITFALLPDVNIVAAVLFNFYPVSDRSEGRKCIRHKVQVEGGACRGCHTDTYRY